MPASRPSKARGLPLLASPDWPRCEALIKAFEQSWQAGQAPAIADHLHGQGPLRQALLVELVHVDLEFRLKAGQPARVEPYLAAYPQLAADHPAVVELLAAERELRWRYQGAISPDEYRARFPQYADQLPGGLPGGADQTPTLRGAVPPARSPLAWPTVPGYEVLAELGRGGMGVVYKAREPSLDRHVALKFLPAEYAADPERLGRFLREARTASGLNHPAICTVHALGEHHGRHFIVMEFIEGRSLQALVAAGPAVAEVCRLVGQAARALAV